MKLAILALLALVYAHGHEAKQKPDGVSWQDWHMLEEHQLDLYSPDVFFMLHDLQNKGRWSKTDILSLYGLLRESIVGDGSGMGEHEHSEEVISQDSKDHVVSLILNLMDTNGDGEVSLEEWQEFAKHSQLPDFGYGQGHHLDFEGEYEEHHWKKYHSKDDPDVLIKHKEDIEHELLHHEHEIEESHGKDPNVRKLTQNYLSEIKLENIPAKYRK